MDEQSGNTVVLVPWSSAKRTVIGEEFTGDSTHDLRYNKRCTLGSEFEDQVMCTMPMSTVLI
jgi:hypothetical protein